SLTAGSYAITLNDTMFTRTVRCGNLTNNPLAVSQAISQKMRLFPNPCHDIINLDFPNAGTYSLKVFNSIGMIVKDLGTMHFQKSNIEVNELVPGQYFVVVQSGLQTSTLSFLKK